MGWIFLISRCERVPNSLSKSPMICSFNKLQMAIKNQFKAL